MNNDFLSKARPGRTVLQCTRPRADLPNVVLYLEWLSGVSKRRVVDNKGQEHILADKILQSNYKLIPAAQADALIAKHWQAVK